MQGSPTRGRPRSFDIDNATSALEDVLWRRGYRSTSVEDLARAAGLSPSSLYAAYGNKEGVLRAVLARYRERMAALVARMVDGDGGLTDVVRFVGEVKAGIEGDVFGRGCLMVNTMVELGDALPEVAEATAEHRRRVEDGLVVALRRAVSLGELAPSTVRDRARLVMASLFGALAVARSGDRATATRMLDALRREITRWRLAED